MRVGTDIIEIDRIRQAVERQPRFPEKVLTAAELKLYEAFREERRMSFLAGRFSVKEAYGKAMGTGIGRISFTDISILPNDMGAPILVSAPLVDNVHLSISHSRDYATATVIVDLLEEAIETALQEFFENKYN
ncbi:holo-ACP synthase [Fundicoccus sp. Sow4_D5]|uniref:holo-ACP synthase n=1 Tax=unclassified Fundicoccus TaxID=2761543 RepID=UPI003F91E5B3